MRTLLSRILIVGLLALTGAAATAPLATAQSGAPFAPLPQAVPDTPTVATTASSTVTTNDDGLSRLQQTLIFLAGVALLAGIAFAIVGDARKNAPVTDDEREGAHTSSATGARKAQSKAKARKKGKAQRAARKHNR